jgi:hypothetical protein
MRAKAVPFSPPGFALALGLGLATIIGLATLAKAAESSSPQAKETTAGVGFVCQAAKGDWCDLRDWSGMDHWSAPTNGS